MVTLSKLEEYLVNNDLLVAMMREQIHGLLLFYV